MEPPQDSSYMAALITGLVTVGLQVVSLAQKWQERKFTMDKEARDRQWAKEDREIAENNKKAILEAGNTRLESFKQTIDEKISPVNEKLEVAATKADEAALAAKETAEVAKQALITANNQNAKIGTVTALLADKKDPNRLPK